MSASLLQYLLLGAMLVALGLYGAFTRRHAVLVLLSLEVMLGGVVLNFLAFSHYPLVSAGATANPGVLQLLALFTIVIAAAELALGLAVTISLARLTGTSWADEYDSLKH